MHACMLPCTQASLLSTKPVRHSAACRPGEATCAAQDALDRVITRMFEPEEGKEGQQPPPERVELVLLVDRVYMGIIVGKGGENVNRIRQQSGCTVQIQPKGHGSVLEGPDEETIVVGSVTGSVGSRWDRSEMALGAAHGWQRDGHWCSVPGKDAAELMGAGYGRGYDVESEVVSSVLPASQPVVNVSPCCFNRRAPSP